MPPTATSDPRLRAARRAVLIGAPVETGTAQRGCIMGPASLRTAGLAEELQGLGWQVRDAGDLSIPPQAPLAHSNRAVHHLAETIAWTKVLRQAAREAAGEGALPIFMGGDHSMAAGTIAGMADHAAGQGRPLFVLWLDAHPDLHSPDTTVSGNLHGTPMGYVIGRQGFDDWPEVTSPLPGRNICMMGLRSVDGPEAVILKEEGIDVQDMRALDETGVLRPLRAFLERVAAADGMLHVSFDVDFLDPEIAPAVGTTVPGGTTFREAHLIMEELCDSGLVTSLDLVELNPFLDMRGRTARLMCDLVASLCGRRVLDRSTQSY